MKKSISIKDLMSINHEPTSEDVGSPSRSYQNTRFYSLRKCRNIHFLNLYCKEQWNRFKIWRRTRKNNFFYQMYLHLTLHLLLLSIFEPIFFFKYASKIEQQVFMNQVSSYFQNVNDNSKSRDFSFNISSPFPTGSSYIKSQIEKEIYAYQNENKKEVTKELNYIHNKAEEGRKKRNLKENELKEKAGNFALWFGVLFGFGAFLNIFIFRINWWKLLLEHIVLMAGIGLYELWFFQNILLKYEPLSPAEIDSILAPCLYKIAGSKITIFNIPPFVYNGTTCEYF